LRISVKRCIIRWLYRVDHDLRIRAEMKTGNPGSTHLRNFDWILLVISMVLGVIATLRSFGTGDVTIQSALFLSAAVIAAIRPLTRLIGGESRSAVITVIFGAHVIATLYFFPPEDIINSRPVLSLDHALHYQQVVRAKEIFRDSYRLNTYDPYFMAGYPGGTVFDIDSKAVELWCSLPGFVNTARSYKFFILAGHLLLVFTVYAGSRRLGFGFEESVLSTLMLLAFWHWGRPYVGEFRFGGMFSFLTVSHLSFYIAGLFKPFLREERIRRFWIIGPLAFLIHPTTVILLPVPFIVIFLIERRVVSAKEKYRKWKLRLFAKLIAWCLLVIAVNAVWLVPLLRYLDIKVPSKTFFQIDGIRGLLEMLVKPGNLPVLLLITMAITGLVHLIRSGRSKEAAVPAAGGLFLLIIAAFGIYVPIIDQMEPGRFLVPALIFMAPLSGAGLAMLIRATKNIITSRSVYRVARTAVIMALLISSPVLSLLASRAYYRHTLSTTFTPEVEELIAALEKHTEPSGRLMIEDGPAWYFGDSFLIAMIPQITGVEQIGGPYPWMYIKHNFTDFHMCRAMEKSLQDMGPDMLWRYIHLYNIRWIMTSTSDCREYIDGFLDYDPVWSSRHFSLWEVEPAGGSMEERGISIRSSYGRIEVILSRDEGGNLPVRVLLPYHWDRGLHVEPPAAISKEHRMDDPVPFIILEPNGVSEIRIEYD
jgi:hypothetical protein